MKIAKRTLSIVLALLMLMSVLPITASAATLAITTQPKTSYTAMGETAKATVKATGDGLTYQWYIKNVGQSKYSKSSVTKATYSAKMSEKVDDRYAYCIVKDKYGNEVRSKTVALRLKLAIDTEPKTTYTKLNNTVKVSVKATGSGLKYQWYVKNAGGTKYSKSSVTSSTYSAKMSEKVKDRLVYCVVTDKYGKEVRSKTVALREAVSITTQPGSIVVNEGERATVSLKASGSDLTYKWYYKNKGASDFKLTTSFTSNSYYVTMNADRDGRQVYCVITDKYGKKVTSEVATLSMKAAFINITAQPLDRNIIEGNQTSFIVAASGSGKLTYQWQHKTPTGSWTKSGLPGNKTNTITVTATEARNGFQYRCKITCGNTEVYSNAATFNVIPVVEITGQPQDNFTEIGKGASFSVVATPADPGYEIAYQWQYRANSSGTWENMKDLSVLSYNSANSSTLSVMPNSASAAGYQFRCAVTVNEKTVYSKAATLTEVRTPLTITPDSASGNYVEVRYAAIGEQFTLNAQVSGGAGGYQYEWYVNGEYYTGTSDNGILTYTATFTNEMAKYSDCRVHPTSTNYLSAQVEVTDAAGNKVRSAEYHVHKYVNIYYDSSELDKSNFVNHDNIVTIFYATAEGGNPAYIEYQWQYSMDGTTWADITVDTINSGVTKFAYEPTVNTSYLQCRSMNASFLGDSMINNGGVWLRCKATDTFRERTIYSTPFAWVVRPTVTARVSGGRLYVDVSSTLGNITKCEWWRHQGQWYINESSASTSTGFESRWDGYKVYITYDTGVQICVEFDEDGNIIKTIFSDAK